LLVFILWDDSQEYKGGCRLLFGSRIDASEVEPAHIASSAACRLRAPLTGHGLAVWAEPIEGVGGSMTVRVEHRSSAHFVEQLGTVVLQPTSLLPSATATVAAERTLVFGEKSL
jgi:hypothetical protein